VSAFIPAILTVQYEELSVMVQYDVVIAGGGMVGATLAALLGQQDKRVALLETTWPAAFESASAYDMRVSALSRASQALLAELGIWERVVAMRAAPYEAMQVWDATGAGQICFNAADLGEADLGHIVENRVIQLAALDALQAYPSVDVHYPASLASFMRPESGETIQVTLDSGEVLAADLLVGADGARSRVRNLAALDWQVTDYAQKGVVTVAQTALPHQETAWQRFMPSGPLAFLPLPDAHYCSIVWTLPADRADTVLGWEEGRFRQELARALDHQLGEVLNIGERGAFPLRGAQAGAYVQARLALVGDAAHTIHPLAGQGVNLGFKDVAALAEALQAAPDVGSLRVLRRYERGRRGDNVLTQKAMEGFRLLFGNEVPVWQFLRNSGLSTFDKLPVVKYQLARQAMGL